MDLCMQLADERIPRNAFLRRVKAPIDRDEVGRRVAIPRSRLGRTDYDLELMIRILALAQWCTLLDRQMEEALRERLSFMPFCDLSLMAPCFDHTTTCRFRNALIRHGRHAALLAEVNRQLEELGLKMRNTGMAVVDRAEEEVPESEEAQVRVHERLSVDGDARWLKKGSKCHYGYKGFMRCDGEGFVERVMVRPANESEAPHFGAMVEGCTSERVLADKAYSSTANRALLRRAGIMHRAARNRPLTAWQKLFNRLVSRDRYVIEQVFGTLKRRFGCFRARCMGLAKVEGELTFKAAAVNVLKAANMVRLVAA